MNFCTCVLCPCQPLTERFFFSVFFFARQMVVFFFQNNIWALRNPKFPAKKKEENHPSSTGRQELRIRAKNSGYTSKKRCEHLGFCAENTYFAWLPFNRLISVWDQLSTLSMT